MNNMDSRRPERPPLLALKNLSVRGARLFSALLKDACATAAGAGPSRAAAALRRAFSAEYFAWPSFTAWRRYFERIPFKPATWMPWMVSRPYCTQTTANEATEQIHDLLVHTVASAATNAEQLRQLRIAQAAGEISGARIVTCRAGTSALCMEESDRVYENLDDMPTLPRYPGCRCTAVGVTLTEAGALE